jgi:hypothetical protein
MVIGWSGPGILAALFMARMLLETGTAGLR